MSMKKFKDYLKTQDDESLRDELLTLYKTFEVVREFYTPRIEPSNIEKVIDKYKQVLKANMTRREFLMLLEGVTPKRLQPRFSL